MTGAFASLWEESVGLIDNDKKWLGFARNGLAASPE
jgi:hypothetical protein